MAAYRRFKSWMLNGHPGNVSQQAKQAIVRGVNADLVVTATTDGVHAANSWHKVVRGRNPKGRAVDLGLPPAEVGTKKGREKLEAFQRSEFRHASVYNELIGPINGMVVLAGHVTTLPEGTALEDAHDNHVHCAPRGYVPWPPLPKPTDAVLLLRARRHGAHHALKIMQEARRAKLPLPLAFALVEHESTFRNIFGHDHGGMFPGQAVTADKVKRLVAHVHAGGTSNGVGLTQLTWIGYLDAAQKMGGAHKPRYQLRVGFSALAALIRAHGETDGCRRYNGTGPAAVAYSVRLRDRMERWERILEGK